jgi:hypothetical protein
MFTQFRRVLVVRRRERSSDRPSFGVADVLRDLVAERALAEARQTLVQGVEVATGTGILRAKGIDVSEQVIVDQRREPIQLQEQVLERRCGEKQLAAVLASLLILC